MSRIYFHSQHGEAEVLGSERALFGCMVNDALIGGLGLNDSSRPDHCARVLAQMVNPPSYLFGPQGRGAQSLITSLRVGENGLRFGGREVPAWILGLNSLLAYGSDPVILGARLHGQCEIHCYVEDPNRAWLAEIIDRGRASGIYREGHAETSWESVAALLRSRDDEPIVTSYSVCDSFPDAGVANAFGNWSPNGEDWDDWYDLSDDEQWRLCLEAIRSRGGLEMRPDEWRWPDYYFEPNVTAQQVAQEIARERTP